MQMHEVRRTAARRRSAAQEEPGTGTRRRALDDEPRPLVLIVDDADDTRDLYSEFFVDEGLRVATAVDGEHALWKVDSLVPSIVVMDLSLPVLDGWEATRRIKAHPKTAHIPIIVLTGHKEKSAHARARAAGADVVLVKPCGPDDLLTEIRRLLPRGDH